MIAWTGYHSFLMRTMVISGTIFALSLKWMICSRMSATEGPIRTEIPLVHVVTVTFFAEALCLFAFGMLQWYPRLFKMAHLLTDGNTNFNPLILLPAPCINIIGMALMYVGLSLANESKAVMYRGFIVLFVALLSDLFLRTNNFTTEWRNILILMAGLAVVGLTEGSQDDKQVTSVTGDLLIILAQLVFACQMVFEEKRLVGLDIPPLLAVGWKGVFGILLLTLHQMIIYYTPFFGTSTSVIQNISEDTAAIIAPGIGAIVSGAFFCFASMSLTKELSATTSMVLDSLRTMEVVLFSCALGFQSFHGQILVGFTVMLIGLLKYMRALPSCRPAEPPVEILMMEDLGGSV